MKHINPPHPPVIGDGKPNVHSGVQNKPIHRVVIHSAVMPCEPGRARQLGQMNQTSETGSWHYAADPDEVVQCSFDSYVCWHAPPNPHSLGIEMADFPVPWPTSRTKAALASMRRVWRWRNHAHKRMLEQTARLTAHLCLAYEIPLVFLNAKALKAGHKGVTTHANVTKAFGESTHWDPGAWPRRRFMKRVRHYAEILRED